jgi:hypothetical protein
MDKAAFEAEGDRLLALARGRGVTLRLLGALAFAKRCPGHSHLQDRLGRKYTDIDFAAYGRDAAALQAMLAGEGYRQDPDVFMASGGARLVADHPSTGLHLDVFFDRLEFCHIVPWKGRLEIDTDTIPLTEMLLQKMQIVEINEKDLIDTIMLLLEHPLTEDDTGVDLGKVARLCAGDWGWWRTLTMNLDKVRQMAAHYDRLSEDEKARVGRQVEALSHRIDAQSKSVGWRVRAKVGDRKKWYREVGELTPVVEET